MDNKIQAMEDKMTYSYYLHKLLVILIIICADFLLILGINNFISWIFEIKHTTLAIAYIVGLIVFGAIWKINDIFYWKIFIKHRDYRNKNYRRSKTK